MEIEVSEHSVRAFLPAEYAPPPPPHPGRGVRRGRLGAAAPRRARVRGRRAAPCPGQARRGARVPGGGRARRRCARAPGRVREAAEAGRALEIDYLSGSRDELTTRTVEPVQVVTIDGHWYLDAYCHRAGDMRRFRVDRIGAVRTARPHGRRPVHGAARPLEEMFVPGPGAVEVHLQLGRGAQWVPESVPVRAVRRDADGTVTDVVLDVSGMAWFERLLLQLGPAARVVSPPELTGLAADAARRVLARYEEERPAAEHEPGARVASGHERQSRFQPGGDRRVPGQPRRGRGRRSTERRVVLLTTTGAKSGHKRVNPARRPRRGRHALRVRVQGRRAHQPRLVPQPPGPPRGRGRVRRRAGSWPSPLRSRAPSGTGSSPRRWRSSPASPTTRRRPTG